MCKICDITNDGIEKVPPSPFDDNDLNRVTNGVWIGEFTIDNLPVPAYIKTAEYLKSAVSLGFAEYDKVDELLKADLLNNIYLFSGAKTYQQVRTLTSLLADEELKSNFYKFKEAATPILHDYNVAYLQTEYYTSKGSARMAAFWDRIGKEADVLPLLRYQTIGDARVRPTHQALDGIIRPVNDSFWDNYYPINGYRCRCTVEQLADGEVTDLGGFIPPDDVPPEFMMNSGKDGYIFKEKGKGKHPYFDVAKGDKELAKRNFNLPIPAKKKVAPKIKENKKILSESEKAAVEWYVSGDGMWINQYLRDSSKFGSLSTEENTLLNSLTTATNNKIDGINKVYRSLDASVLFKGITESEYEAMQNVLLYEDNAKQSISLYEKALSKKIDSYTEKGFISTTKDFNIASDFKDFTGSKMPIIMDLSLGETAKGLDITKEMTKLNEIMKQEEVLLTKNQTIEIFGIKVVDGNIVINGRIK